MTTPAPKPPLTPIQAAQAKREAAEAAALRANLAKRKAQARAQSAPDQETSAKDAAPTDKEQPTCP